MDNFIESDKTNSYIYSFSRIDEYELFTANANALIDRSQGQGEWYTLFTRDTLLAQKVQDLSITRSILGLIILLICVISGLSIMSVVFFSTKERIPEIGIRKAFGASPTDIAFQILCEMIIISAVASVFAIALSLFLSKIAETFINTRLFVPFVLDISPLQLLSPLLVGLLVTLVCASIPCIYAARIKVTEALKFE